MVTDDFLNVTTDFSLLSLRDLLAARELFHLHLINKPNVVATAVGRYRIRKHPQNGAPGESGAARNAFQLSPVSCTSRPVISQRDCDDGVAPVGGNRSRSGLEVARDPDTQDQPSEGSVKGRPQTKRSTPRRNDPCPCGSGVKYKHCCASKDRDLSFQHDFALARYRQGLALETQGRDRRGDRGLSRSRCGGTGSRSEEPTWTPVRKAGP